MTFRPYQNNSQDELIIITDNTLDNYRVQIIMMTINTEGDKDCSKVASLSAPKPIMIIIFIYMNFTIPYSYSCTSVCMGKFNVNVVLISLLKAKYHKIYFPVKFCDIFR